MQKRQIIIIVLSIGILLAGYFTMDYLSSQKPGMRKKAPKKTRLEVQAQKVSYEDKEVTLSFNGRVVSGQEMDLVAEASGVILPGSIALKAGSTFEEGDILFRIYQDEKELEVKALKSDFVRLLAQVLVEMDVDFPTEAKPFHTFLQQMQIEGKLPGLPAIQNEKLKVFLANRRLLSSYYQLAMAELQLQRHTVYAPSSGSLCEVYSESRSYTQSGKAVARMVNTKWLEVEIAVDNDVAMQLQKGDQVQIYSEAGNYLCDGSLTRKSNFIDAHTQSTLHYVRAAQNDVLKIGQYLKVKVAEKKFAQVMEVPREAIFDIHKVHTVEDGLLKIQAVDIVLQTGSTVLFRGLESGTQVVTEHLVSTRVNTAVSIAGAEESPAKTKENKNRKAKAGKEKQEEK